MSTLRATNIKHESSATNQIVLGADGSIGGTLGDTLARKAEYLYSASAPSSPNTGDLWMDTSGASPKGKVWDGSEWKSFSGAGLASFDEGASSGATFSTLTNPDGDGIDYRLAAFTTVGSSTLAFATKGVVHFLLVAGGGGMSDGNEGGGGAGGMIEAGYSVSATSYTITIGAGGVGGNNGGNSTAFGFTAFGGGKGGGINHNPPPSSGGSGGGAGADSGFYGGAGGTAAGGLPDKQGSSGGAGNYGNVAGGGGGAGAAGGSNAVKNGQGGNGRLSSITGTALYYATGGSAGNGSFNSTYGRDAANTGNGAGGGKTADGGKTTGAKGVCYVRVPI